MSNPSTVFAVTPADVSTVSAMPDSALATTKIEPAAAQQPRRAIDLTLEQRQVLLVRCAEMVSAKHPVVLPWGIDLRSFLTLFDRDLSMDFASSNALRTRTDLNRREVSRLIAVAGKIDL